MIGEMKCREHDAEKVTPARVDGKEVNLRPVVVWHETDRVSQFRESGRDRTRPTQWPRENVASENHF